MYVLHNRRGQFWGTQFLLLFLNSDKLSIFLYSGLLILTKFCLYLLVNISVSSFKKSSTSQETFISLEDVLKISSRHVLKTSSTRLQRNNFPVSITSWRRLENVLMTTCKDVLNTSRKTSWRLLGRQKSVTLKTSSRCVKTSWRHLARRLERRRFVTLKISLWRLEDMSWRGPEDMSSRHLQDILATDKMFTGNIRI